MSEITNDDVDDVEWIIREDCSFCGEPFEEYVDLFSYDSMNDGAAAVLNEAGWAMAEDDEQVGIACPRCVEELREED